MDRDTLILTDVDRKAQAKPTCFDKITDFLFPSLVLLCPWVYFVTFNDYGFLRTESLYLFFVIIAAAFLLGALLLWAGWVVRVIVMTLTATLAVSFLPEFQGTWPINIAFLSFLLLAIFLNKELPKILAFMAIVFIGCCLYLPVGEQLLSPVEEVASDIKTNKYLPPIIHIVLDEHIGIDGIPDDIEGSKQLKKALASFYVKEGFHLYSKAYSHYTRTYNSIPNLLNFMPRALDDIYFVDNKQGNVLTNNNYFKYLSEKGYKIRVYQPNFINFCKADKVHLASCYTYPVHSIKLIQNLDLSHYQSFLFLSKSFLLSSRLYQGSMKMYQFNLKPMAEKAGFSPPSWGWYQDQISTIPTLDVFDKLQADLVKDPRGYVFFAHVLLPHSAYIYDQDCYPKPDVSSWLVHYDIGKGMINTPENREKRYLEYNQQLWCAKKKVAGLFDSLKKAGIYQEAIIIVHGDHGSRIMLHPPFPVDSDQLTWRDIQDAYSTLYAIKSPYYRPANDSTQVSIDKLLADFTQHLTEKRILTESSKSYVFLTSAEPKSRALMPEYSFEGLMHG